VIPLLRIQGVKEQSPDTHQPEGGLHPSEGEDSPSDFGVFFSPFLHFQSLE
jgi:hypothetical protein